MGEATDSALDTTPALDEVLGWDGHKLDEIAGGNVGKIEPKSGLDPRQGAGLLAF